MSHSQHVHIAYTEPRVAFGGSPLNLTEVCILRGALEKHFRMLSRHIQFAPIGTQYENNRAVLIGRRRDLVELLDTMDGVQYSTYHFSTEFDIAIEGRNVSTRLAPIVRDALINFQTQDGLQTGDHEIIHNLLALWPKPTQ